MKLDRDAFIDLLLPEGGRPRDVPSLSEIAQDARTGGGRPLDTGRLRAAVKGAVAGQILADDPPAVWRAATLMMERGLAPEAAAALLVLTLLGRLRQDAAGEGPLDVARYQEVLDLLPPPDDNEVANVLCDVVDQGRCVPVDDAERRAADLLGIPLDDEPFRSLVDEVFDALVNQGGPLVLLSDDRLVHRRRMTDGTVLTHRLTREEQETDVLNGTVDLSALVDLDEEEVAVTLEWPAGPPGGTGAEAHVETLPTGPFPGFGWHGPDGWLEGFEEGALLAVRRDEVGLHIQALEHEPPAQPEQISLLASVYHQEVAEPWMPVEVADVVFGMLVEDPGMFDTPRPPLAELCRAAGLEVRGSELAHDDSVWEAADQLRRYSRLADRLDDPDSVSAVNAVLRCFAEEVGEPSELHRCLDTLADPDLLAAAADELVDFPDDPSRVDQVARFADRLVRCATKVRHVAAARWLEALVAERRHDPLAAQGSLEIAVAADPRWGPAVGRLAWYRSDRGDADGALRLYGRLSADDADAREMAILRRATRTPAGQGIPGRNTPCWCGSGRKFKQCHLGKPPLPPLSERVDWLYHKATNYLRHHSNASRADLFAVALVRADLAQTVDEVPDPEDSARLERALADPLVFDLALVEMGWFAKFLSDRGPLLPDDEALLAATWELRERTLLEVTEVHPGEGVIARDLRNAEVRSIRDRAFSHQAKPRTVFCARPVPDGTSDQLVGGGFFVSPGAEANVLDLLDDKDAFAIADYLARGDRPPVLQNREGEPLTLRTTVLRVPDPAAARAHLAQSYEPDGEGDGEGPAATRWVESHPIGSDEHILRAQLALAGDRLTVETNSEARFERVLQALTDALGDLEVVSETRTPLRTPADVAAARPPGASAADREPPGPEEVAMMEEFRDHYEQRWCEESIPALSGLTPRQAAEDPTRRETLVRLLLSFEPATGEQPAPFAMRPWRLRQLLGLDPDG